MQIPTTPVRLKTEKNYSLLEILCYIVLISIILYFGKTLFIPLSFSLLISFILYPVCKWLEKKGVNKSVAIGISIFVVTVFLATIIFLLVTQLIQFSHEWNSLKEKLILTFNQLTVFFSERFGVSAERQSDYIKKSISDSGAQIIPFLKSTADSFSSLLFFLLIVPVFSALILYHRQLLANVIFSLFPADKKQAIHEILIETIHSYYNFIKGMLIVYFVVGMLNSFGLLLLGIPNPFFFGFVASILTFIPYIGIMIASLLPITVSWITYGSVWYPLGVILVFTIVQVLEANVIFPLAVSSRLNVNTLVVLIIIMVGGILWGAAGMILFIPFLGIIKLIADRVEGLKALSILLSSGVLKEKP